MLKLGTFVACHPVCVCWWLIGWCHHRSSVYCSSVCVGVRVCVYIVMCGLVCVWVYIVMCVCLWVCECVHCDVCAKLCHIYRRRWRLSVVVWPAHFFWRLHCVGLDLPKGLWERTPRSWSRFFVKAEYCCCHLTNSVWALNGCHCYCWGISILAIKIMLQKPVYSARDRSRLTSAGKLVDMT